MKPVAKKTLWRGKPDDVDAHHEAGVLVLWFVFRIFIQRYTFNSLQIVNRSKN